MDFPKCLSSSEASSLGIAPLNSTNKVLGEAQFEKRERPGGHVAGVDIDLREVYFLIMHFLSAGPCQRTFRQFWNELLEHQLLPRRYHAWYSRNGVNSRDENDDGISFPLNYNNLVDRYPHIEKDHLVKLLKQLILSTSPSLDTIIGRYAPTAADVPTLLGSGSFSLLPGDVNEENKQLKSPLTYLHWPHMLADHVHGLGLREIGGGFTKHHRAPSIRSACYTIAKPSTMVQKMQNIKKLRGHRNAVYCSIFDQSGRYVITGSDDRLVKIWSMETAFCLASCRGHEGDITDLAVSSNNAVVASASNDFNIRVWRLPDGLPISVLRGHAAAVTAIAFSPRPSSVYQLLSSSDDGTCRIWDARYSQCSPRIYVPKPSDPVAGKSSDPSSNGPSSSTVPQNHQILCCAYNANGMVFVTGSSDTFARTWNACKFNNDDSEQPHHEMDILSGHENDVNYVQFSGCAVAARSSMSETSKEEKIPKFKNSWFCHDNIVTCSRDGSAIIWIPRSRRYHGKVGRWTQAYHLKVPPPPMPPQPPRGGPRQRLLPTPRGVNMIVWSLDNRFVLAAIMDCRICVWNASDGSLVHSLTGHSASTYVLDVHPFNPRIAMSAGYDGQIIVWDIWEGTPIWIHEIGRFKLVDGKFSPDGTSIVLSDDVGQIYLLDTGQGESQKDAKYDQFFLGDYRPLIWDALGNVLDQETQLAPHRRNIQDPLCDSSMIPYPEPYQSMYQQRRLGALGIEWHPSVKFSIGTDVISLVQDYQMPPLADLDRMIEPVPEFIDATFWEPENDVMSDDNDSEYNIMEEYSSEAEQENLISSSSSDPECSATEAECSHRDGLRRSRRKNHKAGVEFLTSSRRHVKRRNLDDQGGTLSRSKKIKYSKNGRKALKRKFSKAKLLRPQRMAARNALNSFSQMSGTSTDKEDEDSSDGNSSDKELMLQDSNTENIKFNKNLQILHHKHSEDQQPSLNELEDAVTDPVLLESQANTRKRRKLILKFSIRDSNKSASSENLRPRSVNLSGLTNLHLRPPQETTRDNSINFGFKGPGIFSVEANEVEPSHGNSSINFTDSVQHMLVEDHVETSAGCEDNKIRLGDVKVHMNSSKSEDIMLMEASAGSNANSDIHNGNWSDANGYTASVIKHANEVENDGSKLPERVCMDEDLDGIRNKEVAFLEDTQNSSLIGCQNDHQWKGSVAAICDRKNPNEGYKDFSESDRCQDYDTIGKDVVVAFKSYHGLLEKPPHSSLKLRISARGVLRDHGSPSRMKFINVEEDPSSRCNFMTESPLCTDHNLVSEVKGASDVTFRPCSLPSLPSDSTSKMHDGAPVKAESYRVKMNGRKETGSSNAGCQDRDLGIDLSGSKVDAIRRTRSMGMKVTSLRPNAVLHNFKVIEGHELLGTQTGAVKSSLEANNQFLSEEWISSSKMKGRSRSSRNRRVGYNDNDSSFSTGKKSACPIRKISWLMLSEQEEGYRYIPQLGDEVVYLRQGHQEYIESSHSTEVGPWRSVKGSLSAIEFCTVEGLDYATLPGSGESCCKITLKFTNPNSSVLGKTFKLTLPELIDFPDFVVEKTWYDAAIMRSWTHRDKCLVWWRNENKEGGSWWEGRILTLKAKSYEFPDSPWERYVVQYKSDPGGGSHLHSPWELHDPDYSWEQPQIEFKRRNQFLSAFSELDESVGRDQDYYGVKKLNQVAQKLDFFNRFPVPLYPEVIRLRLECNYYRNMKALEHDVRVMLRNAQSYFVKNAELSTKMRRLSDWFMETLPVLQ